MKKIIALLIVLVSLFSIVSCGAINKDGEVSVLWSNFSDKELAEVRDALDRAFYIENIKYTHYDAEGTHATQLDQAKAALDAGAVSLLVNLVSDISAPEFIALAKAKNVPIVFLCSNVSDAVLSTYDSAYSVSLDENSYANVQSKLISDYLLENYESADRDGNGKISYVTDLASVGIAALVDKALKDAGKAGLELNLNTTIADDKGAVELIITNDNASALGFLKELREVGYNKDKLKTHLVLIFTKGIRENASFIIDDGQQDEAMLEAYTVMSAIDNGFIAGATIVDDDAIALTSAALLRNLIKGKDAFEGVNEDYVKGSTALLPYTAYQ